jgi:hypothetical protein
MVKQIENSAADASGHALAEKWQGDAAGNLDIERGERRETLYVPRADVGSKLVFHGVGKTTMQVVNGNDREFPWSWKRAPE